MPSLLQNFAPRAVLRSVRIFLLGSLVILGTGCTAFSNTVTLKTEMPPEVSVYTTAYYYPMFGGLCFLPDDYTGDPNPDRVRFSSPYSVTARTSEFKVELLRIVAGCYLELSSFDFSITDMTENNQKRLSSSGVELSVNTMINNRNHPAPRPDEQVITVSCRYKDSEHSAIFQQELECKGLETNSKVLSMLQMKQLQGKTLRLRVTMVDTTASGLAE